tara:strand:- start:502 stop:807 length:306 start_codon:yes stop_codon:yes gene_type:complete
MWEDILKRKKIDFPFLKEISINLAETVKGRTLVRDEFLDFLENIREIYLAKYPKRGVGRKLATFKHLVPRILVKRGRLEIKLRNFGPQGFRKDEKIYIFKE